MLARYGLFAVLAVALTALPAGANTVFSANLSGLFENPANASTGAGAVTVTLFTNQTTLTVAMNFSGLSANATAAHIHCCSVNGGNAPVAIAFNGFPQVTSGTYSNTFFIPADLTPNVSYANFLTGLFSRQAYVNIHDASFPGGEIRGFLVENAPEPATIALMGLGLAMGAMRLKRRRNRRQA